MRKILALKTIPTKQGKSGFQFKSKNKTLEAYLKLTDSIIKLHLLYTSNCWEDFPLKNIFLPGKVSLIHAQINIRRKEKHN